MIAHFLTGYLQVRYAVEPHELRKSQGDRRAEGDALDNAPSPPEVDCPR